MCTRTATEWERLLADQVPAARVRDLDESLASEQVRRRGVLQTAPAVPEAGADVMVPAAAVAFADDGPAVDRPPPLLGEHSMDVLAEAGIDETEAAALVRDGVVAAWSLEVGLP